MYFLKQHREVYMHSYILFYRRESWDTECSNSNPGGPGPESSLPPTAQTHVKWVNKWERFIEGGIEHNGQGETGCKFHKVQFLLRDSVRCCHSTSGKAPLLLSLVWMAHPSVLTHDSDLFLLRDKWSLNRPREYHSYPTNCTSWSWRHL